MTDTRKLLLTLALALGPMPGALAQAPPDTSHLLPPGLSAGEQPARLAAAPGAIRAATPHASRTHTLPFEAEHVELRLAVANPTGADAARVVVTVERAPAWLAFHHRAAGAGDVVAGTDASAVLAFAVRAGAPVGEVGEVVVRTEAAGGRVAHRTLAFVVAPPAAARLLAPYPNPASETVRVAYELPSSSAVTLRVYDALGREVAVLAEGEVREAGRHAAAWDTRGVAAGAYLYRLTTSEGATLAGRLTVVR